MTEKKQVGPKRAKRSVRWEVNTRLLLTTLIGVSVVSLLVGNLYWSRSRQLSSTILDKAEQAEQEQDWEEQIRWLQRYRLLFPDDLPAMTKLAIAADAAVDSPPANRRDRVDRARQNLGDALSALARAEDQAETQPSQLIEQQDELRRRLIRRQLQFGIRYADEAERQIVRLGPPPNDAEMLRSMATALVRQMSTDMEQQRDAKKYQREQAFWLWLSQQPVGNVTELAWRANQDDLNLSAQLIDLCFNDPDRFTAARDDQAEQDDAQSDHVGQVDRRKLAEQVAEHLAAKTNSGQAQLILYRYEQQTKPGAAADRLAVAAVPALDRLRAHAQQVTPVENEGPTAASRSREELPVLPAPFADQQYLPRWDYDLVLYSALELLQDGNSDQDWSTGTDRLDQLLELSELDIPAGSIESVHLSRGQLSWDKGQTGAALRTWQRGMERLNGNSLKLRTTRAFGLVEDGQIDAAAEVTQDLTDFIERRSLALAGPEGASLGRRRRLDLRSELDSATWSVRLFEGRIALMRGDYPLAVARLQAALDSQYPAPDPDRAAAALLLASAYERTGSWDLSATAYERAVNLKPDEEQYRVRAAQAWARAGNSDRSFRQWQAVQGDSPQLALARIRAIVNIELSRPPVQRDYVAASREIRKLRALVERLPQQDAGERANLEAELELLALAIPERGEGQQRVRNIERLGELSKQFPDNPELQSVAAISLAAAGQIEPSREALSRLRTAAGENSSTYQQTLARTAAIRGDWQDGIDSLVIHAKADPDDAKQSLQLAADLARANGDPDQAYQLLQQIPTERRTPDLLFDIFSLSMAAEALKDVPDFNEFDPKAGPDHGTSKNPGYWEHQLRELEGDPGTWWRLAKADRLLAKREQIDPNDPRRGPLLSQVESLQKEIRFVRPRWGLGHSLEGRLAAIRGESKLAIDALRRGIADGDRRVSTLLILVGQLTQANRIAEAEAEYGRFQSLASTNSAVTTLAVAIAEKKGEFRQGLDLARAGVENNSNDVIAWLLLAQAAFRAALSTDEVDAKNRLIAEAKQALERGLQESGNSSLAAYQLLVRFQATFFGRDEVRGELDRALKSEIKEPTRSLFVGRAYVELGDADAASPVLSAAVRLAPSNPDVYLAMADYYQLIRDDAQTVEMLEKAYQVGPTRIDVRNRLALAIALRKDSEIPWRRLDQLLAADLAESSSNKLLHALILMTRGGEERQKQAARILRDMITRGDRRSDDATRMLAALERRRWVVASNIDADSVEAQRALAAARSLYTTLTRRPNPASMDLYRFGDLLLQAEQTTEVQRLADQLDRITQGSPIGLDLRLRLARQLGQEEKAEDLASTWAEQAIRSGSMLQSNAWETAGRALSKLGFHDEALTWLEQSYQEDPGKFRSLVVALARSRKLDRALEVCRSHYKQTGSPEAVALMADVVVIGGESFDAPDDLDALFDEMPQRFASVPALVESIATLRLSQHRYAEAVKLYEQAEKLTPKNLRVLNNLAMALSEIPDRAAEAMPRIQTAIDLYGRSPELLDTQGLVLLRNDRSGEAVTVLREATVNSEDPRYRFHLVLALMRTGDQAESLAQWTQLDVQSLKKTVLTPAERRDLEMMQKEFNRRRDS